VKNAVAPRGPSLTPFLQYQVDQAWIQDERRRAEFADIRTEEDMRRVQARVRRDLLDAIGGLPETRSPLNAQITGKIQLDGYRIEKVIFESLPGVYVPGLLYLPDGPAVPRPAVLVPCGHSTNGKIHYQYICSRLAKMGYVALSWDPVGQGERSQFWDASQRKSRYNLVCGEHAVLGNLAYLAGTNIARWEVWDGMRALDYLLARPEVDPNRISITGTSGGGFQAAHIGALDPRVKVIAPSCYISALPMRMNNRIFEDPDSDPEQDLAEMVSRGVDHAGLLLLAWPRPVFVAAAAQDFFPIEGTRRTWREVAAIYGKLGHPERIGLAEGYHRHQYSTGNLAAALNFMNRFNGVPGFDALPAEDKLEDQKLLCTKTGQVLLEFTDAKNLTDVIREYYLERKTGRGTSLTSLYRGQGYSGINSWTVAPHDAIPSTTRITWQAAGSSSFDGLTLDKYLLHHSEKLSIPLVHVHAQSGAGSKAALLFSLEGKIGASEWPRVKTLAGQGYHILTFDFRGTGEDRMMYQAAAPTDPPLQGTEFDNAYNSQLSGVLANYVYNTLLTGRPYFLQMIEDAEIVTRFAREKLKAGDLVIHGSGDAHMLAAAVVEVLHGTKLLPGFEGKSIRWSEIVEQELELWPIHYLLPGGAYIR
jgi:hypothetical protein